MTTRSYTDCRHETLWIAFKLVSLRQERQQTCIFSMSEIVVNCFQISIFAPRKTTLARVLCVRKALWIAFKLVSLRQERQLAAGNPLPRIQLWIAFKLVSLRQERQPNYFASVTTLVVNCFQISIFAPRKTTRILKLWKPTQLWIAFKLVSLRQERQLYS